MGKVLIRASDEVFLTLKNLSVLFGTSSLPSIRMDWDFTTPPVKSSVDPKPEHSKK